MATTAFVFEQSGCGKRRRALPVQQQWVVWKMGAKIYASEELLQIFAKRAQKVKCHPAEKKKYIEK